MIFVEDRNEQFADPLRTRKAADLLRTEIAFIHDPCFRAMDYISIVDETFEDPICDLHISSGSSSDWPSVCQAALLDAGQEQALFVVLNFSKFKANNYRSRIDLDDLDTDLIDLCEDCLQNAKRARDIIINANIRLVISIVKGFLRSPSQFDELMSEGVDALIRAIDKFDVSRGFRFSTYATMVVRRHLGRYLQTQRHRSQRHPNGSPEAFDSIEQPKLDRSIERTTTIQVTECLRRMLAKLDDRERFIIEKRFALIKNEQKRTLSSLAKELGVCKERVRQLEQRAIRKLRQWAQENELSKIDFSEME